MRRDVIKIIEKTTINRHYDLGVNEINAIKNTSESLFETISKVFNFGYAQGMKAAKAEMKKKGVVA